MHSKQRVVYALFVLVGSILLTSCRVKTEEVVVTQIVPETIVEQQTIIERETIFVEVTPTPEPIVQAPRTLVVCLGEEPETLYIHDRPTSAPKQLAARHVLQAVYDGPIDSRAYSYQPIILEKLPSLSDGDAVIETVFVDVGDLVVDPFGQVVILEEGVLVQPAGCYSSDCAEAFDGNPLEMEQMVVTFRLKEGITWSDGEPLTAYDSVYSFDILKDYDTPGNRYISDRTASYEAVDGLTTVWTGLPGFYDDTYFVHFWSPLPEHILGDFTPLELIEAEESARRPLGWGPYIITEWVAGDHITVVKNGNYWRADEGLPRFNTVIFRFVGQNAEASIADLLAGDCDIVDQTVPLKDQSKLLLELEAVGQLNAAFFTIPEWEHADFGINPVEDYDRPDFFEDVRVRQAVAYCMDRQKVVDDALFGQSVVLDTYLPPDHPLFAPDVMRYGFDVEVGSALLEEVGWIDDDDDPETPRVAVGVEGVRDGTPLEFNYSLGVQLSDPQPSQRQRAAEILQASLARCGVQVNLDYWDRNEFVVEGPDGPLFGRRFDVGQFAWVVGAAPGCELYLGSAIPGEEDGWAGLNASGFGNEAYDTACNAALQALPGQPEYEQYHGEAQRIFAEQLPAIPLYPRFQLALSRPDLMNFFVDSTESEMWNIEAFDY